MKYCVSQYGGVGDIIFNISASVPSQITVQLT